MDTTDLEGGAVFVFNFDFAFPARFNPQRYFCQSILEAICPNNETCPLQARAAFFELRVSPIDASNWGDLDSFTRSGRHFVNPVATEAERDFITRNNTRTLGFTPYVVAVWSDEATSLIYIHEWLMRDATEGYVGHTTLDILRTIEEFHAMCREVDLGFDACVKDGSYLYPRGSDHPLGAEVMSAMGFVPT
jgi:hypothetical protein